MLSLIFLCSAIASLVVSSYFELPQYRYLAKVKTYFYSGSSSRIIKDKADGVERMFYNGNYYFNPVSAAQKVIYSSEEVIEDQLNLNVGLHDKNKSVYSPRYSDNKAIIDIADYFIDNYKVESVNGIDVIKLSYDFDYDSYGLKAPWYSGMAQGHISVVMLAAYFITENEMYLEFAKKAINLLIVPVRDGGAGVELFNKRIWFEEYADKLFDINDYPLVLNGNLFAIDGVFLLYAITKDAKYGDMLFRSLLGVEDNIHKYDTGFWSYYDAKERFAHAGYHRLHINQLERILTYSKYIGMSELVNVKMYSDKFRAYKKYPMLGYAQRMIYQRNNMIYIIFSLNFLVIFLPLLFIFLKKGFFIKKNY